MVKPIAAFSMGDYESITRGAIAEFKRGKDKQKRKSRKGVIAAGIGATAALGAAARYGGAEVRTRMAAKKTSPINTMSNSAYAKTRRIAESGGAAGALGRDINAAKSIFGARTQQGQVARDKFKQGVRNVTTNAQMLARDGAANAKEMGSKVLASKAGKIGLGVAGAGALGAAGYGAYKMLSKKNKKK